MYEDMDSEILKIIVKKWSRNNIWGKSDYYSLYITASFKYIRMNEWRKMICLCELKYVLKNG